MLSPQNHRVSTQTTAAINLLRPEQPTTTVYLPYVSTANAAATIIQHAYTKYINHFKSHHHQHVTTNAPTKLDDKLDSIMRAITTRLDDITTRLDAGFYDFKLDNYKLTAKDKFIAKLRTKLDNCKSIAKLDNYIDTATDTSVGDDRLLDDNG